MIVYCYPKCTTCKKAIHFLEEKKLNFEVINIKENPPSKKSIEKWLSQYSIDIRKLLNTSGLVYKELNLKEEWYNYSKEEQIALLANNGMLIKRPICVLEDKVLIGFQEKIWEEEIHA